MAARNDTALEGLGPDPRLALNELNQRFLEAVNDRKRIFISHAVVRGAYLLRVCVLSFRTHMPDMERALEDIREVAEEVR